MIELFGKFITYDDFVYYGLVGLLFLVLIAYAMLFLENKERGFKRDTVLENEKDTAVFYNFEFGDIMYTKNRFIKIVLSIFTIFGLAILAITMSFMIFVSYKIFKG